MFVGSWAERDQRVLADRCRVSFWRSKGAPLFLVVLVSQLLNMLWSPIALLSW